MDRRLLALAILAFTIELLVFFADSGLIPLPGLGHDGLSSEQRLVGEIEVARQNVRRRNFDSSIWEDSNTHDLLYENDSILTLTASQAKIRLRNDTRLELNENTLVVLEPMEDADKPFRLRFARGDLRARNTNQAVELQNGDWSITATPGADLSLRSVDSGRIEVQVISGEADVRHRAHGIRRAVKKDQRLMLMPEEASEVVTTSQTLRWADPRLQRIYSHRFPVKATLTWEGEAQRLEIASPTRGTTEVRLPTTQVTQKEIELEVGSYHLTLFGQSEVSRTLMIEVQPAPKFTYLTPLPRDRLKIGETAIFTWLSEMPVGAYRIEFAREADFREVVHSATTSQPEVSLALPVDGDLFWRVIGFDEDNFLIPAAYSYPIYSHPDPLAPPQLRAPTATDEDAPDDASWWQELWQLLLPSASAAENKPRALPPVILNWDAVPGATYYIVEISDSPNFTNPQVVAKTSTNFYAWSNFSRQVYHYRVAGGSEGGRIGIFSAPAKLDLTNWPPPRLRKARTAAPAPVPPAPPIVPPAPSQPTVAANDEPDLPAVVTLADPLQPSDFPIAELKATPPREQPSIHHTINRRQVWWRGGFQSGQHTTTDKAQASVSGFSSCGAGAEIFFERTLAGKAWLAGLNLQRYLWQPRDAGRWPFQSEVPLNRFTAALTTPISPEHLFIGGGIVMQERLTRTGLESLGAKAALGAMVRLSWRRNLPVGQQRHDFDVGWLGDSAFYRLGNGWRLPLNARWFVGADLDWQQAFGDYRADELEVGLSAGWSW